MFRPFALFVGMRYVRARRRTRFISVISLVALLGLALGAMALVVVLSVMNGFQHELRARILALVPHVQVHRDNRLLADWEALAAGLRARAGVTAVSPWVGGAAMLSAPGAVRGVQLNGIDATAGAPPGLRGFTREGRLDDLVTGHFGIVIGNLLARALGVGVGDDVTVILPEVTVTPAGAYPRVRRFTVVGVFAAGAQVDASEAFIDLRDAARLYRSGDAVQGLRLTLDDAAAAPAFAGVLAAELQPQGLVVEDWSVTQGSLFQAMHMEKRMITLMLMVIVAVAAFNIVSILSMVVAEKRGAIAVLRTMGASARQIMAVFTVQGVLIGCGGLALGLALGIPLALHVGAVVSALETLFGFRVFDPGVYFISFIPSHLEWADVALVAVAGLALCLLATLYPASRAARVGPADVLRYE